MMSSKSISRKIKRQFKLLTIFPALVISIATATTVSSNDSMAALGIKGEGAGVCLSLMLYLPRPRNEPRADLNPFFRMPAGSRPHEDSLKKPWGEAIDSLELKPEPRIHDLRHCWKSNAMKSRLDGDIRDAIVGHGNKKKDPRIVYLSISDKDLVREIDRLTFDHGKTEIWDRCDKVYLRDGP